MALKNIQELKILALNRPDWRTCCLIHGAHANGGSWFLIIFVPPLSRFEELLLSLSPAMHLLLFWPLLLSLSPVMHLSDGLVAKRSHFGFINLACRANGFTVQSPSRPVLCMWMRGGGGWERERERIYWSEMHKRSAAGGPGQPPYLTECTLIAFRKHWHPTERIISQEYHNQPIKAGFDFLCPEEDM